MVALLVGRNLGDLRPLQTDPRHQAFLADDEGVDPALQGGRHHRLSHAFVHDDDASVLSQKFD
jgi:hypothetical protein